MTGSKGTAWLMREVTKIGGCGTGHFEAVANIANTIAVAGDRKMVATRGQTEGG